MYAALFFFNIFLALLLLICWGLAAYLVDRLPVTSSSRRLRSNARLAIAFIVLGELFLLLTLAMMIGLATYGWRFVQGQVSLALPLLLVPGVLAVAAVPRLRRLIRASRGWTEVDRAAAVSPGIVVPVQAMAAAVAVDVYLAMANPYALYPGLAAILIAIVLVAVALSWYRCLSRTRQARIQGQRIAPAVPWRLARVGTVILVGIVASTTLLAAASSNSRLPAHLNMAAASGEMDYGGGPTFGHHGGAETAVSVSQLTGPLDAEPDARFKLTAQQTSITLSSGKVIDAWTFNGQAPGPEIRVHQGDLVEVTLVNHDIEDGVTIHWHGVDVPNAEDGVAGVTQDAVMPGGSYTYRFIAADAGTYWYHSHQESSDQVKRGLFGPLVVEPVQPLPTGTLDTAITVHTWKSGAGRGNPAFGLADTLDRRSVPPGTLVRLRLINTDTTPVDLDLSGTPFQVAAIDGTDLNAPTDLTDRTLKLAAGGRYDLTFTMPETPVLLSGGDAQILFSRDGSGDPPAVHAGGSFDPRTYGSPAPTPFSADSDFDREFTINLDSRFGFYDGRFTLLNTINGHVFPDTPMLMVQEGDLVKVTIVNRSGQDHPMHLHGHHALVLSRDGKSTTGSPWWTDTLNVAPGETFEIAFLADNPGLWMDHCHNLDHAAAGMTMHLAYEGVTTPFEVGRDSANKPE